MIFKSIIMTCINREIFLKKAAESIILPSYQNCELIYVNNNSTDYVMKNFFFYINKLCL